MGRAPSSLLLSDDLQDVCKRAAEKLNIPWPTVVAETEKSRYKGNRLPRAKQAARQLLIVFPELLEEVQLPGRINRLPVRCPCRGGPLSEGMEKEGLLCMPPMKLLVAAHLHPKCTATSILTLPCKVNRFQLMECTYKAIALSVRALNTISMLIAYQAELQDEASTMPGQTQWEEICVVKDLSLSAPSEMRGPSYRQGHGHNGHSRESSRLQTRGSGRRGLPRGRGAGLSGCIR